MKHILPLLLLVLSSICSTNIMAYEQDTVFMADFQTSSQEEWSVMLGEWEISEGHYCTASCSS